MKKVISFSIWGDSAHYILGAILNADIAEKEWPDWTCRFYTSPNVPKAAVDELKSRSNVEVIEMKEDESWNGMFWRFFAASDPEVSVAIFRDTDSRIYPRDKAAVDEWLKSDKDVHILRDNCQHGWAICGGAWGVRNGRLNFMEDHIKKFDIKETMNKHGIDQIYLTREIYIRVKNDIYVHDDWTSILPEEDKHPFPIPRLRGKGWENQEFPEWHSGIEDDPEKYSWPEGHCFLQCPACGEYHDNDYIGCVTSVTEKEKNKYKELMSVLK